MSKITVPDRADTTSAIKPSSKAALRATHYGDFDKHLQSLTTVPVTGRRTNLSPAKIESSPVLQVVGSILLGVLGATTNHPYYRYIN
ncbi:MAG: hypothetical protein ABI174_09575 [Chitinophagaceae bacterium]